MPSNLHDTFRRNVRRRLQELGMTQRDLARSLDWTEAYVSQLLAGRNTPALDLPEKIAPHLQTTAIYLLTPCEPEEVVENSAKAVDAA